MRRQLLTVLLAAGFLVLSGCGGSGGTSISGVFGGGSGSVAVFTGDTPLCDVVSFEVTITGITLTPANGGAPVSVLSSGQSVTVDFASLMEFSTFLNLVTIPAGTYSTVTLTFSNPKLTILDFSQNPPAPTTISATLPSLSVTYNINPALTVAANGTSGLQLDFNLLKSIQTDTKGLVTGNVVPVLQASPVTVTTASGLGDLEDLHGLVQSVSTTGSGSFSGSVVVQTVGTGGGSRTVNVSSSTVFDGVSGLSALLVGTFVEIDAFVDSSGNIVARRVEAEGQDSASLLQAAFLGLVTSVTPLSTGSVSQFTMVVRQEFPDVSTGVPLKSSLVVNVQPSTQFKIAASQANLAQLQFGSTTLGLGQNVAVHGNFQPGTQGIPPVLNATSVFLRLQSVVGDFSNVLGGGGFTLVPCSGIFKGQAISVLTFGSTDFEGVSGLSGLTTTSRLVVKGLVFFEPTLQSAGSVTLSPPSLVLVAKKVRQLP